MTLRQCRSEENGRERKRTEENGRKGMRGGVKEGWNGGGGIGLMRLFECFYFVAVREEEVNVVVGVH